MRVVSGPVIVAVVAFGLAVVAPASAVVGGTTAGATAPQVQAPPLVQSQVDADAVSMRATVRDDGTADWRIEFRVRLDDDNETAAFESVQADVEANATAFTAEFARGMERTVASAENATGREMALSNVTVEATTEQVPREYGVLTYRFTWSNFAAVEGDRLRVGDSLSGLFLDEGSMLTLGWPESYDRQSATPDPSTTGADSVTWNGPLDFGADEPRVVVASGGLPLGLAAVALLVVGLAAGGWLYASRREDGSAGAGAAAAEADGADGAAAADSEPDDAGRDEPPEELLSNEEKVIRLLERNGGRIKQQQIAAEYDWTDAKTSQVVGSLRDDDEVETFRIGRENVVALPEESDL